MKKLIAAFLSVACGWAFAATATFTSAPTLTLNNPERGWYYILSGAEWCNSVLTNIRDGAVDSQPVRLFLYVLTPGSSMTTFNNNLACVRAQGVKVLIMNSYCQSLNCNEGKTIEQVEADIAAMKSTMYANRDVLAGVMISSLGGWGEWASWQGATPIPASVATRTRDAYLAAIPPEVPLMLRNPPRLEQWYGAFAASTAFNGSAQSRIGVFNDCFLASSTDRSTYPGVGGDVDPPYTTTQTQQRAHAASITNYTPFKFETCGPADRKACTTTFVVDGITRNGGIMHEGPEYHVTWGHRGYDSTYMDQWIADGCYPDVNRLMGYRFQFDSLSHVDTASRGGVATFTVQMRNVGWSRVHSQRRLRVVLTRTGASAINCDSAMQLRQLLPQATSSSAVRIRCVIPGSATIGAYNVHLQMPDQTPALQAVRFYTAQPANSDVGLQVWDNTNGRFTTGTTITVN